MGKEEEKLKMREKESGREQIADGKIGDLL
jgi:hypothetical protein